MEIIKRIFATSNIDPVILATIHRQRASRVTWLQAVVTKPSMSWLLKVHVIIASQHQMFKANILQNKNGAL